MSGAFTHFKLHQDYLAQRRESLGKAVTLGCATVLLRLSISGVLGDFTRASPPQSLSDGALTHCASHTTELGWG